MHIALGADHAGFRYKEIIKSYLIGKRYNITDFGTDSEDVCDYPEFIFPVARAVQERRAERGIVVGLSGNGEAMAANRLVGVRCSLCFNTLSAVLARRHNDANILSLGQCFISENELIQVVENWLSTPFEGGRHLRRIKKLDTFGI